MLAPIDGGGYPVAGAAAENPGRDRATAWAASSSLAGDEEVADVLDEPDGLTPERLVAERGDQLMRAAIALTGSRQEGEDLLQAALERLLRNWHRVQGDAEAYLRRILYNLAADGWRRQGRWLHRLGLLRAGHAADGSGGETVTDLRDALTRIVLQLPPRQRAVIVLRYWEQRSEAETAAILGCSEGNVKSATSRGLRRLRELAATWEDEERLIQGKS